MYIFENFFYLFTYIILGRDINMNPSRFFVPRIGTNIGPMMMSRYMPMHNSVGLFGKITNSLRTINWSGLLNGANKTLNVVNQSIPLVRQAGPMFNNMKSMLRLAKMFGNETTSKKNVTNYKTGNIVNEEISKIENSVFEKEADNDSYPKFFV